MQTCGHDTLADMLISSHVAITMLNEPITSRYFTGHACDSCCKQEKLYMRADITTTYNIDSENC